MQNGLNDLLLIYTILFDGFIPLDIFDTYTSFSIDIKLPGFFPMLWQLGYGYIGRLRINSHYKLYVSFAVLDICLTKP